MFTQGKFALIKALQTNDQARKFIRDVRFADGFDCPRCHSNKGYEIEKRNVIECANCGKQTSPTANTIYHGTRTPLLDLKLLALFAAGSNASTRALSKTFKTCYTTMWHHAHVSRLALESNLDRQISTIDCARLKKALFKRSKEEKLVSDQWMASTSEPIACEELVLQTINFILIVFNDVSRKFAQPYVSQYGSYLRQESVVDLATTLLKVLTFGRTARRHLRNYRSPPAVLISSQ